MPQLLDPNSEQVDYFKAGREGVIRITLTNNMESVQPFVLLAEIHNGNGVTEFLALENGFLQSLSRRIVEFTWIPENGCSSSSGGCNPDHEIRAFVVSDFENPQVLTEVQTLRDITVRAVDYGRERYTLYRVNVDDREYDVYYAIDNGTVRQIFTDSDDRRILVNLENVTSETELTIVLPEGVTDVVLGSLYNSGSDQMPNYVLGVLVNGDDIEPVSFEISQMETTWVIPIPEGSEKVEFVLTVAIQVLETGFQKLYGILTET
jgi:hypothetical protein